MPYLEAGGRVWRPEAEAGPGSGRAGPGVRRRRPDPGAAARWTWRSEAEAGAGPGSRGVGGRTREGGAPDTGAAGRRTRKRRRRPLGGEVASEAVARRRSRRPLRGGFRVCGSIGFLVLVGFEPGARQRQRAGARRSAPRRFNALKLRVDVRSIEI